MARRAGSATYWATTSGDTLEDAPTLLDAYRSNNSGSSRRATHRCCRAASIVAPRYGQRSRGVMPFSQPPPTAAALSAAMFDRPSRVMSGRTFSSQNA